MRMCFDLTNAAGTVQLVAEVTLSSERWKSPLEYRYGIADASKSVNNHMAYLQNILALLRHAEVILTLKECSYFAEKKEMLPSWYTARTIRPIGGDNHCHTTPKASLASNGTDILLWPLQYILPFRSEIPKTGSTMEQEATKFPAHLSPYPYHGRKRYSRRPEYTIDKFAIASKSAWNGEIYCQCLRVQIERRMYTMKSIGGWNLQASWILVTHAH